METVATILREKGSTSVHSVSPEQSVLEAVKTMCDARVGAVLVCQEGGPCGIFSERDLMARVILERKDPAATPVAAVMTPEVACVGLETSTDEAMAIMSERRCRHLPVVDDGALVGLVSIGDLVRHESLGHEFVIRTLTDYIHGKYPG